jgi:hypothetical protein
MYFQNEPPRCDLSREHADLGPQLGGQTGDGGISSRRCCDARPDAPSAQFLGHSLLLDSMCCTVDRPVYK